jgi:dipeptidyl aminopeptidase/acylaminoacyl peptidase
MMTINRDDVHIAPYGSWKSPITSEWIVAGTVGLGQIVLDGGAVHWIESRPQEKGRSVIVRRMSGMPEGETSDLTPAPFNARTRVHEYGGGSFAASNGDIWFSNFADQRLYFREYGGEVQALTPESDRRYADALVDHRRGQLICVCEDHSAQGREPVNTLVGVQCATGNVTTLVSGHDFYSSPRLGPRGDRLAYLAWNHPNMPWDGTELWVAEVDEEGSLANARLIAGGASESIFQPEWSPDGVLHFVSDRSGWWNLYRWRDSRIEALCPMSAEFGFPQWVFGMSAYAFVSETRMVCTYIQNGFSKLALLDTATGGLESIETPYSRIENLCADDESVVFTAASPMEANCIVRFDLATRRLETLRRSSDLALDPGYLSTPQAIEFPTEQNRTAHAFFYPPANRDFIAPADHRPPLLVMSHGGPTAATHPILKLGIQYWTSRGIAVLDVNYGGSTGYGRDYRTRLNGQWGIVDVDDCVNGARHLVAQGLVDGERLAITGGSAGGYTTLCALTFRDVFKAGASHYGVSDLIALDEDTHKFESRYTLGLVGPSRELYIARSPIHHTDRLNAPVIFFQGLEDKVVPPNQSERMVEALRGKGLPVAYLTFEGEQHGFRQAANIQRALDGELCFYSRIFGFDLAEAVAPVAIWNLDTDSNGRVHS